MYVRCAFQTVEGFPSILFLPYLMKCYKEMYYLCYIPALLNQCAALSLQMHLKWCEALRWSSKFITPCSECCSILLNYTGCLCSWGHTEAPGATVLTYRWLADCLLPCRAELLSSVFELELSSSQLSVYCSSLYYAEMYSIHYLSVGHGCSSLFPLTAGPIAAVCVLCLSFLLYIYSLFLSLSLSFFCFFFILSVLSVFAFYVKMVSLSIPWRAVKALFSFCTLNWSEHWMQSSGALPLLYLVYIARWIWTLSVLPNFLFLGLRFIV